MKRRISLLAASVALAVGVFAVPAAAEMPCDAFIITDNNHLVNHSGMSGNGVAGAARFVGLSVTEYPAEIHANCAA